MQKSNRFYKTGFFLFLSLLLLLIAAVVPALIKGVSPRQWYGTLLSSEDEDRSKARVIPTSSFTDLELVDSIQPAEQTREALAASANRVVIFFSEPMKTDYDDILANYSVYTKDKPLEFRNYSWRDEKTFVLTFDRSLEEGESVLLDFRFVPADNNQDQLIRIAYE